MGLIVNGKTIPENGGTVKYNTREMDNVIYAGKQVWKKVTDVLMGSEANPLWEDEQHNWGGDENTYDENLLKYTFSNASQYKYITVYAWYSGGLKDGDWSPIVRIGNGPIQRISSGTKLAINGANTIEIGYWYHCEEDGSWEGSQAFFKGWAVLGY